MIMKSINTVRVTVKLRKLENKEQWSLFVESYPVIKDGKLTRQRESVGRYVTTPIFVGNQPKRDREGIIICVSETDRDNCRYAEEIRRKYQAEYDRLSLMTDEEREIARMNDVSEGDFIDYFEYLTKERHKNNSESIRVNWNRAAKLIKLFTKGQPLLLKDLNVAMLNRLREFLLSAPMGGGKKGTLSANSASTYFAIIKAALHQCYVEGYLPTDLAGRVSGIRARDKAREYLTQQELITLAATPCDNDIIKRAALFSALTGARHSDIMKMSWEEIIDEEDKSRWVFKQKKTQESLDIPMSETARALCGERGDDKSKVFDGLVAPSWISRPLARWIKAAGIKKHITFHCFRHTFATLQIAGGTDIFTVSKLLGHTNVRTTMTYAKLVDEKKLKSTEVIKLK